ncbi:MAG: MBL fold metallo-hydrolase [Lachnospiraceae bacterium]|nr:MBL fold metallo-hydrolase [Lachnospiraceae bacterium]
MNGEQMTVTTLGVRGSVPVSGADFQEFGGATTCVKIVAGNEEIYLDAGSGIVGAHPMRESNLSILLTHPHLDHMIGLPFFYGLSEKGRKIEVYMKKRNGLGVQDVLRYLYTPPLWPLGVFDYPADVRTPNVWEEFRIGQVSVETMDGVHPGGVTIFRLTYGNASVVFATDFEHSDEKKVEELISFSKDCSLLIYDGQYTDEKYECCRGFGHSTATVGIQIARKANARRLLITHHDPECTDRMLRQMENEAQEKYDKVRFARCGETFTLGK